MTDSDDTKSIGVWVDRDFLDEWDEVCRERADDHYSRSATIRDAMRMYLAIERRFKAAGITFEREADKRRFVRQGLDCELRRDAEE